MERALTQADALAPEHEFACTQTDEALELPVPGLLPLELPDSRNDLVSSHTPSSFLFQPVDASTSSSLYFCVGRVLPDPPVASFPDGSSCKLDKQLLSLHDPSRGGEKQRSSRQHSVLRLDPDGTIFIRDWKQHEPSRSTRIFLPSSVSDTDFISTSSSSWTLLHHLSRIHFLPFAPPISLPPPQPLLPYDTFIFTVDAPHSVPPASLPPPLTSPPPSDCPSSSSDSELDDDEEEEPSGSRGLVGFKILLEGRQIGSVMGLKAANLFRIQDESGCKLSVSLRDSFFPDTQDRVLFVSGPAACMLATASVAVVESVATDRGKDGARHLPANITFRAAYPPDGPLILPDALSALESSFPTCMFLLSSKLRGTSDRVLTAHGPVPDIKAAVDSVTRALPPDAYRRMEPNYQIQQAPPNRAVQRQRHRAADKRKRKTAEQERERAARDKAGAKRRRGQDNPLKPSARMSRPSGGKSRRR